jgi:hypothetical protein
VNQLDARTRADGEQAAKPWLDALKPPLSGEARESRLAAFR